jgi:uncharacterized protein (TIGR02302 family)
MTKDMPGDAENRLNRPLRLTLAGMLVERLAQAFWPLTATALAAAALILSGVLAFWPGWIGQALLLALSLTGIVSLALGVRRFRPARRAEALARLDATLPGNPIAALTDTQAIGADDPGSTAVWHAHRDRMAARLDGLRALPPAPGLPRRDPFALRLIAATALATAILFGAGTRHGDLAALMPGSAEAAISEASWEGWIEAPSYTGKPTLYLADQPPGALAVPVGSRVTLRLYGKLGALDVTETFTGDTPDEPAPTRAFKIAGDGSLSIGEQSWAITAIPDQPPRIQPSGDLTRTLAGEMRLPFTARDDYGVSAGQAEIAIDLPRVDRRYGLAAEPEPRLPVVVDLPMPYRGDRREVEELFVENLAEHPWAGLPVTVTFTATDAAGQSGDSAPVEIALPGRRFLHPLARAIVEQRRDILWTADNARRSARILRAISNRPEGLFPKNVQYLKLRTAIGTLEEPGFAPEDRDAVAAALWEIAVEIEDGALADALERLRRAQERLSEAMRQGATPEELSELMDEYREAMRDYMRQLGQQEPQNRTDEPDDGSQRMEMTQQDLQAMMDRIDELMQQGRMEEAQQLLDQLQQMMENMQMTEGASGQQSGSEGEQAMEGLADTLRQQQGLSDEAFRDLQRQLDPGGQDGMSGQPGRDGEGENPDGQGGDGGEEGEGGQQSAGEGLAERQRALEDELARQRGSLPGAGTPEGDAAREALDEAGRAMEDAADALEQGDIPGALDRQAEAMESLREGMRNLEDTMRREAQSGQQGDQGQLAGQPGDRQRADPLGRNPGGSGATATDSPLEDREDVYRRAQELMDELRRRSGDTERPDLEREYLKRLLDLF